MCDKPEESSGVRSVHQGRFDSSPASIVDGHPLLNDAALRAAREWRFVAGTTPGIPVT